MELHIDFLVRSRYKEQTDAQSLKEPWRLPVVAEALVGVEAAAWLRAWAGMSMEAKEGLLDNSEIERKVIRSGHLFTAFPPTPG